MGHNIEEPEIIYKDRLVEKVVIKTRDPKSQGTYMTTKKMKRHPNFKFPG